jgi:hypothetical protein
MYSFHSGRDTAATILTAIRTSRRVDRWRQRFGAPPPKGLSRRLLEHAAAYAIQAKAFGDLKPKVRRALRRVLEDGPTSSNANGASGAAASLKPGAQLLRDWNGETHRVEVLADGYLYDGVRYRSLSAVARAITGTRWSGPRFFGL